MTNLSYSLRAVTVMITHYKIVFPLNATTRLPPCYDLETGEPLPIEEVLMQDVTVKGNGGEKLVNLSFEPDRPDDDDDDEFDHQHGKKHILFAARVFPFL